ncbi:SGNH hydrolase [Nadsonia fulvescens var. elongata DSM 6958]|uniref:SGNH hydrolase n=1 Tax=Nadsonia fulvescens var. elongata DSM 6958 TaxID=857566 RepID=A0A1E3PMB2_9ASCO|nr:SGNH hydrolase [Nadsonia fulvescens var. elongata DSM 6958]
MSIYMDKLVLFGDSIIDYSCNPETGFVLTPALQNEYSKKLDVIVRGYSGYNTDHAVHILPRILEAEMQENSKIKLMVIFFGSNDASSNDIQKVPVDRFERNLREMVGSAQEAGVLVILVGPALHEKIDSHSDDPRNTATNKIYSDIVEKVANEFQVPFLNLWLAFLESVGWVDGEEAIPGTIGYTGSKSISHLLSDGLHFSADGYKVFFLKLMETIRTNYSELAPESLPFILPYWREIDSKNIVKSLFKTDSC